MTRLLLVVVVMMSAGLAACAEPRSEQCTSVCKREAECIEETNSKLTFDEKECIAACAALQHDVATSAAKVQQHIACVDQQRTCSTVLECK